MEVKGAIILTTEIICALITTGGVIIASGVSALVSRSIAKKSDEKDDKKWNRKALISSVDELSAMANAVGAYISFDSARNHQNAMATVAAVRIRESGQLGESLDELQDALCRKNIPATKEALSKVVNDKRFRDKERLQSRDGQGKDSIRSSPPKKR